MATCQSLLTACPRALAAVGLNRFDPHPLRRQVYRVGPFSPDIPPVEQHRLATAFFNLLERLHAEDNVGAGAAFRQTAFGHNKANAFTLHLRRTNTTLA